VCKALDEAEAKKIEVDPTELVAVKVLKLDLRLDAARREPDLTLRLEQMKAVLKEKLAFINEFTRTQHGAGRANELPENLPRARRDLHDRLQKTQDPAVAASLRTEGQEIFAQAERRAERAHRVLQGPGQEREHARSRRRERQLMVARLQLSRTYYYHSLLFAKDDPKKPELLNTAVKSFLEFGLAYGDLLLNYEGMVYQGLCHRDLGKPSRRAVGLQRRDRVARSVRQERCRRLRDCRPRLRTLSRPRSCRRSC